MERAGCMGEEGRVLGMANMPVFFGLHVDAITSGALFVIWNL